MQAVHTPSLSRSLKLGIVLCQESWAQCQIARKSSLVAIESLVYEPSYLRLLYNCGYLGSTSALPNHSQFCLAFVPTPVTTLLPEVSFSSWSLQLHPEKSQCSEFTQYVSDVWGPWYSTPKCKRSLVAHRGKKRFVIHEKVVQKCPISSKKKNTTNNLLSVELLKQLFNYLYSPMYCVLSCVRLLATPWTVAHQAPLSMEFPRQEYWVGCHALLQGIFPTQGSTQCLLHWPRSKLGKPQNKLTLETMAKTDKASGSSGSGLSSPFAWRGPGPAQGVRRTDRPAASAGPGGAGGGAPSGVGPWGRSPAQSGPCGWDHRAPSCPTRGFCPFLPFDEKGQEPTTPARLISTLSLRLFPISSSNCKL